MFLNLRNGWPHNAVYKAMNGAYLEGDCNQNILVSMWITIMASSHEVNVNVHMHAHILGSCCVRSLFLPLSFITLLRSEEGETGNKSVWLASLSPRSHLQDVSPPKNVFLSPHPALLPPPLSVLYSNLRWRLDATPHRRCVNVLKCTHGSLFIFFTVRVYLKCYLW